jgi:endo-1,4-beta-xylanase
MKQRLLIALFVLIFIPFLITFRVNSTPSTATKSSGSTGEKSSPTSLRYLAEKRDFGIGAAVEMEPFENDANYRKVLAREFNILVPENQFKFEYVHPKTNGYDFSDADTLVDFAQANKMKVRGSPLVWHYSLPNWVEAGNYTRTQLLTILKKHIQTVVGRYRGKVYAWDVVNEVINRDGSLRDTIWLRNIGPEYIDLAFRWAHEADPDAKLFYSDYAAEELGQKSDGIYDMLRGLVQRGVPVNGLGFQSHLGLKYIPDVESVRKHIKRIGDLGLEVQFTELDVKIQEGTGSNEARLEAQANLYGDLLKLCTSSPNCSAFITWGFTDRYTWIQATTGLVEAPLIFDASYTPKPAYNTMQQILSSK